ncbi:hypothetical protein BKH41_03185 [Helicobacter sp. 12S02232-10]|uniref:outer membrane beta-barrel protein n=1 Tax=Helicobacter sp. 12S02232-10 TaxID=1476197 RepID=UPI000BA6BCD4|nr:outer membrane beta-barrel protein [Helicobacter sp. 12S02232-10]PAF49106.1 hypothetical protein BKH41_03185 [Helicobacter sp. 12S02232-10]
MKKMVSALSAMSIFLISNSLYADDIDEQIQKLEKENKLLELKQKQKELQAGVTNQNQNDKANQSKNAKQNSKNGFSVGIEGTLGSVDDELYDFNRTSKARVSTTSDTSTSFDLGLMMGYQHYFGQSQRHGIKVSGHIYSGFGNSWVKSGSSSAGSQDQVAKVSYIPIKIGLDVKYLWDFLERGKHTLGLNVGVGYQEDMYVSGKLEDQSPNSNTQDLKLNSIFSGNVYPVIGLHYYYSHHQFELMWRGGGALIGVSSESETLNNAESNDYINQKILSRSYLTFNYAYRF